MGFLISSILNVWLRYFSLFLKMSNGVFFVSTNCWSSCWVCLHLRDVFVYFLKVYINIIKIRIVDLRIIFRCAIIKNFIMILAIVYVHYFIKYLVFIWWRWLWWLKIWASIIPTRVPLVLEFFTLFLNIYWRIKISLVIPRPISMTLHFRFRL